jgi:RNA polymerase sigma-70 factor (ECF subfamily)
MAPKIKDAPVRSIMISAMQDLSNDEVTTLLNQIASGNDKAATQLYQRYFDFLYAYVRHQLADSQAAEDVTQEVFVAVFLKPQTFAGNARFSTWLCGIAKNKCVDWWRKNRIPMALAPLDENNQGEQIDPNWDFVANLETQQNNEAMRKCIDKLPTDQREAIFWVHYQEEGLEAVAKHLDCPVGTVKSRLFNARTKLRDCMSRWLKGGRNV